MGYIPYYQVNQFLVLAHKYTMFQTDGINVPRKTDGI